MKYINNNFLIKITIIACYPQLYKTMKSMYITSKKINKVLSLNLLLILKLRYRKRKLNIRKS